MRFRFIMRPLSEIKAKRGLQDFGPVQRHVDSECIRLMAPYTPFRNGALIGSVTLGTKIGSGELHQIAPYSRFLYHGKLMVSSITGSPFASKGEKKILTDIDLKYYGGPTRGAFWFERMKEDHKEAILKGAQEIANRGV